MKEAIILSSKHNYAAIIDLCRGLEARGYWDGQSPIDADVAGVVGHLFESIAWSDRSLHRAECQVLDALMEEDDALGGSLVRTFSKLPDRSQDSIETPAFIRAAKRMDETIGSAIAAILVNQLDSLALLIAQADNRIDKAELQRIALYRSCLQQ